MSIGAIIPSLASLTGTGATSLADQIAQALKDIQTSLKAGDVNGAAKALDTFQKLVQTSASANGGTSQSAQIAAGIQTLKTALGSGNLDAASLAFNDLKASLSPAAAPKSTALTLEDVVTLLSALPGYSSTSSDGINPYGTSSAATDVGSNLLSSISAASSAANIAAATQATARAGASTASAVVTTPVTVPTPAKLNVYG